MKKICLIYANCQNKLIAQYLNRSADFAGQYAIHCFPVHDLIEQGKTIPGELIQQADLFIYQPVKEHHGDRSSQSVLKQLPANCHKISFPSLYFKGYFPQFCKNPVNRVIKPNYPFGIIPHGDANIISLLNEGKSESQIVEILSDPNFYSQDFLLNNVDNTLRELATRESQLDIKISNFIRQHYQDSYLFYTQNHPSDLVGFHIVNQILDAIALPRLTDNLLNHNVNRGVLDNFQIPLYPSVINHLNLRFIERNTVFRHGSFSTNQMSFSRYISEYVQLSLSTADEATNLHFKSITLAHQQKNESAVITLQKAIALKSDNATYYGDLGIILEKQNKLDEAILAYQKAISLSPTWEKFYLSLGRVLCAQNNFADAISLYTKAIAINPQYGQFYRFLGDVLLKQQQLDKAEVNYRQAIVLDPTNAFNYRCLGDVFRKKQLWQQAASYYQRAIELSPKTAYFYNNLADVLAKQNKLDRAIDTCKQATKMFGKNSDLHRNLGNFQLKKGNIDDALIAYQTAIKLNASQMDKIFPKLNIALKEKSNLELATLSG